MGAAVLAAYWPMRALPDRSLRPPTVSPLRYEPVPLPATPGPFTVAGAWRIRSEDPRFGGLSALAIDQGRFLTVSDLGAAIRFDPPTASRPLAEVQDLAIGPGPFGKKWSRDAESLVRDGRGWWVGYEQSHSLWLYDGTFARALDGAQLPDLRWGDNRGAEGLLGQGGALLVLAENGHDAVKVDGVGTRIMVLDAGAEIADAASAPDGGSWVLLRRKGLNGIDQSIGQLRPTRAGFRVGQAWPVPKAALDNYEGLAIVAMPDGRWRFWLVTDDGHRLLARTLLVALDYRPAGNDKSPAPGAGLLKAATGKKL